MLSLIHDVDYYRKLFCYSENSFLYEVLGKQEYAREFHSNRSYCLENVQQFFKLLLLWTLITNVTSS